jgi:uncharacterized protein YeaO (DUF488 family)
MVSLRFQGGVQLVKWYKNKPSKLPEEPQHNEMELSAKADRQLNKLAGNVKKRLAIGLMNFVESSDTNTRTRTMRGRF